MYLGHETGLFLELSIVQNLKFFAQLGGAPPKSVDTMLEKFSLTDYRDIPLREASAGLKQRTALARVFLNKRDLLYLDEPLHSLDKASSNQMQEFLQELLAQKTTILLSTHHPELYYKFATHYIMIEKGKWVGKISNHNRSLVELQEKLSDFFF